jgi:uncharacterized cupin superfamily protein
VTLRPGTLPASAAVSTPWPLPATDELLDGAPERRRNVLWESADGRMSGGVWECEPCRLETHLDGNQMLVVLDGRLIIETGQGETLTLDRGDVGFLPVGTTCVITVTGHCRCAFQQFA